MPDLLTAPTAPGMVPLSAAAEWDAWYARDARMRVPITDAEIELFHQHVDVASGMLALDAGCGTGHWSRRLAAAGLGVLGMDVSPTALAMARWQGSGPHLLYAQHDFVARSVPASLQPGTFDLIMCRNTLPYLDRERFLVDAGRWLTPKGQLHLTVPLVEPGAPPPPRWARGLTPEQIRNLGAGWRSRTDYPLDASHVCVVLSGYADAPTL